MMFLVFGAAFVVLAGHLMFWVAVVNRLHATPGKPGLLKILQIPLGLFFLYFPWSCLAELWRWSHISTTRTDAIPLTTTWPFGIGSTAPWSLAVAAYAALCSLTFCVITIAWWRRRRQAPPAALRSSHSTVSNLAAELPVNLAGNWIGRICAALPLNELFHLDEAEKVLALPNLPRALHGLRIAHWSDLHLTGRIGLAYFEELVRRTNAARPDLIVVTGDVLDAWECTAWLPKILGQLRAPEGVWFILGNHDLRPKRPDELRRMLVDMGLVDWGGKCGTALVRGCEILVAGNECPWFGPAPLVPPKTPNDPMFRLLLSHAPDTWKWAASRQFDLMLAGHTHGGQIVFPLLGPTVSPSRYGVEFAGGLFQFDNLVMHVSRGVSSEEPLRWRCPPELATLVLHSSSTE